MTDRQVMQDLSNAPMCQIIFGVILCANQLLTLLVLVGNQSATITYIRGAIFFLPFRRRIVVLFLFPEFSQTRTYSSRSTCLTFTPVSSRLPVSG